MRFVKMSSSMVFNKLNINKLMLFARITKPMERYKFGK
jgi:hypothetical protein